MKNIIIQLSTLWIAHFLIWSFGDILRLLQPGYIENAKTTVDTLLIASFIGLLQVLTIAITILSENRIGLWVNILVGGVFLLIDIGWFVEIITTGLPLWESVLVIAYIILDLLILFTAYQWSTKRDEYIKNIA
jgi:hypothetical protein